jgi:phosphoserine phosphatase
VARKLLPLAICYDFDGTLAPGNMQERDFIPKIGMTKKAFWQAVAQRCEQHQADNILIYMGLMLQKAAEAQIPVRRTDFAAYGKKLVLFPGVADWFDRINEFGRAAGFLLTHHVISSGIREMVEGTLISKHFENIYASSFVYDHHGVAYWPALALNYTTKTQYLFRINKGATNVYDHKVINAYVAPEERPIPFTNMIYIGDGETDVPCFRLVKDLGGHSIAVYKPHTPRATAVPKRLFREGRVNFFAPADYQEGSELDQTVKAVIDKIASDQYLSRFARQHSR